MSNRLQRSLRATFIGFGFNAFLAAGKMAAGILGNSHALIADGVESLGDLFSSIIVWRGLVIASQPADQDHPYGHGKAEPIAAAVVSSLLLLAASAIGFAAFQDISHPKHGPAAFTLAVLILVIPVKETLFRFVKKEADALDSSAVRTDAWHHRSDAITSLAAGIGIAVALIGGKGYESADDVAAIFAACMIAWNGWHLLRPALDELMDAAPAGPIHDRIREISSTVPGVEGVEKCLIRKMGYQFLVDLHVEVDPQMSVLRSHEIAHRVKDQVRAQLPTVMNVLVHIEPVRNNIANRGEKS
jgi:cation diffusion facilitator family transporter